MVLAASDCSDSHSELAVSVDTMPLMDLLRAEGSTPPCYAPPPTPVVGDTWRLIDVDTVVVALQLLRRRTASRTRV